MTYNYKVEHNCDLWKHAMLLSCKYVVKVLFPYKMYFIIYYN